MTTHNRLAITEVTSAYWRVIINNPPINLYDPEMFAELNVLMDRIESNKDIKVIVFESANPDYFISHYDIVRGEIIPDQPGAAEFGAWPKFVTRLAQSRVVSVAKLRGRARGHGSELALACDIRFASKEKVAAQRNGFPRLSADRAPWKSSVVLTTSTPTPPKSTGG
jgi:enoyl-CoA hydratase/carnithine racemase